jgi:hypothetical protein
MGLSRTENRQFQAKQIGFGQKASAPLQDRGAKGPPASISFHDRQERVWCRIGCMWTRSSNHRRRRHKIRHRHKPQPPQHRASAGSHGHSCRSYFERSCWRYKPRRDPRHRENWLGRHARDHAIRQHPRDEADHPRSLAEVRPRRHGAEGQRQVRPKDHRGEDRRRLDREEDPRQRGREEDQRAWAEDPGEGRTAPVQHWALR